MWSSCALPDHHVFMYVLSSVNLNLWVRNCLKRPRDLIADRVGIHAIPYPKIYTLQCEWNLRSWKAAAAAGSRAFACGAVIKGLLHLSDWT